MSLLSTLVKSQEIISLSPGVAVFEAAVVMAEHKVGSVLVMDGNKLAGIFTERDLLNRVVSRGLDFKAAKLSEVMSKNVATIDLAETVENCFRKMESTKCRRLPILDKGLVVGMVTMRNILEWIVREIELENIQLKRYIQS